MKREDALKVFEAVKVMPLRSTDVIVLRTSQQISTATAELVKRLVQEETGHPRVLVLGAGMDMDVLRHARPWWKFWGGSDD